MVVETLRNVSTVVPTSSPPPISRTIRPLGDQLSIQIEFDEGQWVAVERYTGMFGEGDTRDDALADLARGLNGLRHELAMNRVNLAPRLQGQLAAIEAAIGPAA